MKVLLIIANTHLWRSIGRSFLIWLVTGIAGGITFSTYVRLGDGFFQSSLSSACLGLFFSSPVILISIPVVYFLFHFETTAARIIFSILSILFTCTILLTVLAKIFFDSRYTEILEFTLPFILSAFVSYFLIMWKPITKSYPA